MKKLIVAGIIALGACLADASKPTDNISLKNLAATLELSEEKLASFLQTEGVSATDVVAYRSLAIVSSQDLLDSEYWGQDWHKQSCSRKKAILYHFVRHA